MKRLLFLILFCSSVALAQQTPQPILATTASWPVPFAGAPTGPCLSQQTAVNTTNGNFYSCNNSVWQLVSGFGGSIGGSCAANQIAVGSGVNTIACSSAFTFQSNQLSIGNSLNFLQVFPITGIMNLFFNDGTGNGSFGIGSGGVLGFQLARVAGVYSTTINASGSGTGRFLFANSSICVNGQTSGGACFGVAAVAGTPNALNFPITTGSNGQVLCTDGGNPQQVSWCANGAGTVTGQSQFSLPFNSNGVSTALTGAITAPALKGQYGCGYTLPTDAAVAPTCLLTGLVPDAAAGAAVLFSDNNSVIYNPPAALSLPTPTTLENSNFFTTFINNGAASTITPVTWTISLNGATPGATAVVGAKQKCSLVIDQTVATQWDLDCVPLTAIAVVNNAANVGTSAMTIDMSAAGDQALILPNGACGSNTSGGRGYLSIHQAGNSELCVRSGGGQALNVAMAGVGGNYSTTCTNQFVSKIDTIAAPTCSGIGPTYLDSIKALLTSDFTDANASGLQAITGLNFTLAASTAENRTVDCHIMWSQATNVADTFGVQDVSLAPTRLDAYGIMSTAGPGTGAPTYGVLTNLTTTTATAIVTATPTVTTVNYVDLHITVQQPSGASSVLQIMVQQATAADVIVIKAGSACHEL